jgi:hypothetical protein
MAEYFAAKMMEAMIEVRKAGLRDVDNPELAPFYAGDRVPDTEIESRRLAVNETNASAALPPIGDLEFLAQAGVQNGGFFRQFLDAAGLERTFTQDTYESPAPDVFPALGYRTSFAASRAKNSIESVAHLVEPTPPVLAESDLVVRRRIATMREYINRYLQPAD